MPIRFHFILLVTLCGMSASAHSSSTSKRKVMTDSTLSVSSAPNPFVGRWVVDRELGVVHFVRSATDINGVYSMTAYNYFSTKINRWRIAEGAYDSKTGELSFNKMMMYAYRREGSNLGVNATGGGVWHDVCFKGTYSNVTGYPQVRWNTPCTSAPGLNLTWANMQMEVVQSLWDDKKWHKYGTHVLCVRDHPQLLFHDGADLDDLMSDEASPEKISAYESQLTDELVAAVKKAKFNRLHPLKELNTPEPNWNDHNNPKINDEVAQRRRNSRRGMGTQHYGHHHHHDSKEIKKQTSPTFAPQHRIHGAKNVTKVHVIFTQHLDLGYTDYAYCVLEQYFWEIFPGVALTASELQSYVYTTHPWLLYAFFNCEELLPFFQLPPGLDFNCPNPTVKELIEQTIKNKQLVWHAFPFDGYNEMMGPQVFDYSFNYAEWLTKKFFPIQDFEKHHVTSIQQVDIPGLYRVQVSPILERGIRGVYVGQNSQPLWAGAMDSMPTLFQWDALPNSNAVKKMGKENATLLMMVHKLGYGGITLTNAVIDEATGAALMVMCSNENRPSFTPQEIQAFISRIWNEFPNVKEVKPSTFDEFVDDVRSKGWPRDDLPRFSVDVGDSWVRNSAGDPGKVAEMQSIRRQFEARLADPSVDKLDNVTMNAGLFLTSGAEHNWGLSMQPNDWESTILSYQEKRGMVTSARQILPPAAEPTPPPASTCFNTINVGQLFTHGFDENSDKGGYLRISFGKHGSIDHLSFSSPSSTSAGKFVNTTVADRGVGGGTVAQVIYAVHDTQSPTWGDPLSVVLEGKPTVQHICMLSPITDSSTESAVEFEVKMWVNQSYFNYNQGRFTAGRNIIGDVAPGYRMMNDSLQLSLRVKVFNPRSFSSNTGGAKKSQPAVQFNLAYSNLALSDTSGFYHAYFSDQMTGNSLSVQFDPIIAQCETAVSPGPCATASLNPPTQNDSSWGLVALDQEYSPYNFHINGTCNYHILDSNIYRPAPLFSGAPGSGAVQPFVNISSKDVLLMLFGWNSAQFGSEGNLTTYKCVPDTSTGIWYNIWNLWNGNWCVGYPWKQEDGLSKAVNVRFELAIGYE